MNKVQKEKTNRIFIVLGIVWVVVGLVIFKNEAIWPLGFIFLIIGLIRKYGQKKDG